MSRGLSQILSGLLVAWGSTLSAFDFHDVRSRAEALVKQPYEVITNRVPETFTRMSYDEYWKITNRRTNYWQRDGLPMGLQFFHQGYIFNRGVKLHEIDGGRETPIPFNVDFFKYGTNHFEVPPDMQFAGFRLLNFRNGFGEVASFLGASYFRMIGKVQAFGTSARGLALNTTAKEGEEFPVFEQFWIRRPDKNSHEFLVYALLDSPSATGAYQFNIQPGEDTVATVKVVIFLRQPVKEFGLAPLTSMFLYGENGRPIFTDFRPEVHDADGLLIENGRGEWLWHPLEAGKMIRANRFEAESPSGFGLMQRDRDFEHYQDDVAKFEHRPSVWVKPLGKWGRGSVQLVQLPSDSEYQDNVVAFWVPADAPQPGQAVELNYELHWTRADPSPAALGHVRATRIGRALGRSAQGVSNLRFVVDFEGKYIESVPAKEKLSVNLKHSDAVTVVNSNVFKNEINNTWRLAIEIADPGKAIDLRAFLLRGEKAITETWTFTWQP